MTTVLFIGNPTRQRRLVHYHLEERSGLIQIDIPPNHQTLIEFASPGGANAFIEAETRYGIRQESDIDQNKAYAPLVYSFDKPITGQRMTYAAEMNYNKLVEQGKSNRAALALSAANIYDEAAKSIDAKATSFTVGTREVDAGINSGDFEETITLEQSDENSAQGVKRGRGRPPKNQL